jgi:plasmid stabilization system protein ParE
MAHRVAEDVDLELDDIWLYIAKQSSSIDIADHVVDCITACFVTLGLNPRMGRRRDEDLALGPDGPPLWGPQRAKLSRWE